MSQIPPEKKPGCCETATIPPLAPQPSAVVTSSSVVASTNDADLISLCTRECADNVCSEDVQTACVGEVVGGQSVGGRWGVGGMGRTATATTTAAAAATAAAAITTSIATATAKAANIKAIAI